MVEYSEKEHAVPILSNDSSNLRKSKIGRYNAAELSYNDVTEKSIILKLNVFLDEKNHRCGIWWGTVKG